MKLMILLKIDRVNNLRIFRFVAIGKYEIISFILIYIQFHFINVRFYVDRWCICAELKLINVKKYFENNNINIGKQAKTK